MKKDYKDTLQMMSTAFSMRANLTEKEPILVKQWHDGDIYKKSLELNKGNETYVLHDGPPYANGNIHVGHALNKILKDFIVRYKTMKGFYAPYIPGWDTHGLPIETALTNNSKINRKELSVAEFRALCHEYALKQVTVQKEQFKRLGVLGDWNKPYITLDKEYEAVQVKIFAKMVEKNFIFKGLKPVFWSPSSESALAEAEIEYQDVQSDSIYLAFKVVDNKGMLPPNAKIVIWTTTPWTIPANLAVAVNPLFTYVAVEFEDQTYIIAKELIQKFSEKINKKVTKYVGEYKGSDLEYITYQHPLNKNVFPIILGEHVTLDAGTGLVHTAPGHGEDDFNIAKKYNIGVLCPVDDRGYMTEEALEFAGLFYAAANKKIINKLNELGSLVHHEEFTHSYPHDWRTRKPVIFRATPQWFASIENLKEDLLQAVKEVAWLPSWGELRISNMIKDRKEWCISRQRVWGVPIPIFYCEDGTAILDQNVILHVSEIFKNEGSNAWFTKQTTELLPPGYTNIHSPNGLFTKENDIMDVWFDSGSSHHAALLERGFDYPCDLYIEGSDQYRGWFNSSLSTGVAMRRKAPYKMVISHGFVLHGNGNKMSKSLGNTIDPLKICDEYGADILRLWVASVEYTSDVRISIDIIKQNAEAYRKIRNTFRFLLGNTSDFNPLTDKIAYKDMPEIDRYMIVKLQSVIAQVYKAYDDYAFDIAFRLLLTYMANDLSAFYLDFTKDILYIEAKNNRLRRSIQTVFYENLITLVCLFTPLIPFTCEEVYSFIPSKEKESVYLERMPEVIEYQDASLLLKIYEEFQDLRDDVLKAIEVARNNKVIGKSLLAKVSLKPTLKIKNLLAQMTIDLKQVFITSEFVVTDEDIIGDSYPSGVIKVEARAGIVCERCWQVVDYVNEDGICLRCEEIINQTKE